VRQAAAGRGAAASSTMTVTGRTVSGRTARRTDADRSSSRAMPPCSPLVAADVFVCLRLLLYAFKRVRSMTGVDDDGAGDLL
jgi:hypothetical protein